MTNLAKGFYAGAALLFAANLGAKAESVTTGDLGPNVITGAESYTWSPNISAPFGTTNGTLTVEFNMWAPPFVVVHVSVNGAEVGTFMPDRPPFLSPGSASFDIGSSLVDGTNTIIFDGLGIGDGQYTISRATLNYELGSAPPPPPPPPTNTIYVSTNLVPAISHATVLHYLTRAPLAAPDGSIAAGELRLQFNQQKKSSLQNFDLAATGLSAGLNYSLLAITATETNAVSTVKSDKQGRLKVSYSGKDQGKDSGKGAFPTGLDSVMDLVGVGLTDGANIVAWTWVNTSTQYDYLVKRNLTPAADPGTAAGAIKLKASAEGVMKFAVGASGLTAGRPYHLALNSVVVASLLADANGRVGFVGWPADAPPVIDLRSVAVLDDSSNAVLVTELP